jgi:hypothetical protein
MIETFRGLALMSRLVFARLDFDGNSSVEFDRMRKYFEGSLGFCSDREEEGREKENEDQFLRAR